MCFLSWTNREEFHWHCFKFILFKEIKFFIFTILKVTFSDNCVNRQYFLLAYIFVKLEISASWLKPREICSCTCRDVFINAWIFKASSIVASIIKEVQNMLSIINFVPKFNFISVIPFCLAKGKWPFFKWERFNQCSLVNEKKSIFFSFF